MHGMCFQIKPNNSTVCCCKKFVRCTTSAISPCGQTERAVCGSKAFVQTEDLFLFRCVVLILLVDEKDKMKKKAGKSIEGWMLFEILPIKNFTKFLRTSLKNLNNLLRDTYFK